MRVLLICLLLSGCASTGVSKIDTKPQRDYKKDHAQCMAVARLLAKKVVELKERDNSFCI